MKYVGKLQLNNYGLNDVYKMILDNRDFMIKSAKCKLKMKPRQILTSLSSDFSNRLTGSTSTNGIHSTNAKQISGIHSQSTDHSRLISNVRLASRWSACGHLRRVLNSICNVW